MAARRRRLPARRKVRRWIRKQDRFTRGLLVAVLALSVLVVASFFFAPPQERPAPGKPAPATLSRPTRRPAPLATKTARRTPSRPAAVVTGPTPAPGPAAALTDSRPRKLAAPPPAVQPETPSAPAEADGPRIALVIDDLGQNLEPLRQLGELGIPLSIAILPQLEHTAQTVRECRRLDFEILLHLPMEPRDAGEKNPGPGALLTSMSPETIRTRLREALAAVPGAVGVNNHMGSRFTTDPQALGVVMPVLKEAGLFWLDSRTAPQSLAYDLALGAGLAAADRDIFLDAETDPASVRRQVERLIELARKRGSAIGIGHPHPATIAVLTAMREELLESGVTWVPVSALLHRPPGQPPREARDGGGTDARSIAAAVRLKNSFLR
jgi:polysaccharide deacetylase 2 family uncharacterized protein YibQ